MEILYAPASRTPPLSVSGWSRGTHTQAHTRVNHEMDHILVSRFSVGFVVNIIKYLNTGHTSIRFSVLSVIIFYTTINAADGFDIKAFLY